MKKKEKKKPRINAKRPLPSSSSEIESHIQKFKSQKLTNGKSSKIETFDYFSFIPEHLIKVIFNFLPQSSLQNLKMISKEFYNIVFQTYTTLDFKNKSDIPLTVLQSIIKHCLKLKEIKFGQMKNLTSVDFMQNIFDLLDLNEIRVFDFSLYSELNDEILLKCFKKLDFNRLIELYLPYSCKITNDSLSFIQDNFRNLNIFQLDSKYSKDANKDLNQETIAKIINKNDSLTSVKLKVVNHQFLRCLNENSFKSDKLLVLNIRILELKEFKDIKAISALNSCVNLNTLALMEIFVKNKIIAYDQDDILEEFEKLFKSLVNLTVLKLGHFTTPILLDVIRDHVKKIEYFKVVSEHLEIEEIQNFFFECTTLVKLKGNLGSEYSLVTFHKRKIFLFY